MPDNNSPPKRYREEYKRAAADFVERSGHNLIESAAELGVDPGELREWTEKEPGPAKSSKSLSAMAQLRAENESLRNQILQLQMQWDILRTTLGVLSTTVCSREAM
ncbi:MAG TPA: transposase [Verrucomicrobiae bacterium]|jgi:transposase-like protein|nr:transposase [Verrucomicrobiae bacterium]